MSAYCCKDETRLADQCMHGAYGPVAGGDCRLLAEFAEEAEAGYDPDQLQPRRAPGTGYGFLDIETGRFMYRCGIEAEVWNRDVVPVIREEFTEWFLADARNSCQGVKGE